MKKHISSILLVLVFFVGLCVLLYPTISDYINSKHQSRAIASYDEALADMSSADYSAFFAAADDYNQRLRATEMGFYTPDIVGGYWSALNVSGTGIMGYITIEKIKVELPIYHGTDASVLNVAVGHLQGTSLPVGGESTHCVMSAHRGLPSAKLFTNLDKLEEGDTFTITILNRLLTYQIDQILIVLPHEVDALHTVEGEDYCTLVTCTPYGINSHRLLVRGTRVENAAVKPKIYVTPEAYKIDPIIVTPLVAVPMLLFLLIFLLVKYRKPTVTEEGTQPVPKKAPPNKPKKSKKKKGTPKPEILPDSPAVSPPAEEPQESDTQTPPAEEP